MQEQPKNEPTPRTPQGWMLGSEYVAVKGRKCPKCGDGTRVFGTNTMTYREPNVLMPCRCDTCGARWDMLYALVGYDPLTDMSDGAQGVVDATA